MRSNRSKVCSQVWVASALLFLLVCPCIRAKSLNSIRKLDSSLALLYSIRKHQPNLIPEDAKPFMDAGGVDGVIASKRQLTKDEEQELERIGVRPKRKTHLKGGGHTRIPWSALEKLEKLSFVDAIESEWHPSVLPCLDISVEETGAVAVWGTTAESGLPLTGQGIIIADFDTGVDVFHPGLWRADGPTYQWLDVNSNGVFDQGIDAVDLNGNGTADVGESLRYLKGSATDYTGVVTNNSGPFVPKQDWLYNDANGNGTRNYGTSFGESTPTYGERIFVANDTNGNSALDPSETVTALGTCKVAATLNAGGVTRTRGVNLISTPADTNGHGTSVCGILAGQTPGLRKYVGIAPGAELLVADRYSNGYGAYIVWAEGRGANVMLYEFGSWVYQFMDGSSTLEQFMNHEASKGIVQVAPAGNLGNVKKHAGVSVPAGGARDITINVPAGRGINSVYLTVIWTNRADSVSFSLVTPSGGVYPLLGDMTFRTDSLGNSYWSHGVLESPIKTRRIDVNFLKSAGVTTGYWKIRITSAHTNATLFHAYVSDNLGVWSGGTYFQDNVDTNYTTTWPATAQSALVAGSYSTRGIYVKDGEISLYSGAGPTIMGTGYAVDLCAPGNSDVFTLASKDAGNPHGAYRQFGGTSAAAAHAAGAAALVLQANPDLSSEQVSELIYAGSSTDNFTGQVPDTAWGYGKLNILPAVENAASPALDSPRELKARCLDGDIVRLWGKIVVAAGNDGVKYCYVEEPSRTSGIKICGYTGNVSEGDKIEVTGTITTVNGERQINATDLRVLVRQQTPPPPVALNALAIGGATCPGTPGVWEGVGVNNIGVLVTTWGKVVSVNTSRFYIDGGNSTQIGVSTAGLTAPAVGDFVAVTGVSSVEMREGLPRSLIRPRRQSDIAVLR